MMLESQAVLWRRFVAIAGTFVGTVLLTAMIAAPALGQDKDKPEAKPSDDGAFFNVDGAKDCAYDESRHRLYVTTPEQLVVVDTKEGKVLPGVDLPGSLLACDVSPDFKYLAIGPAKGQFLYWLKLDWTKPEDMDFSQVRFKADGSETGVYSLAVSSDDSVLFSMTFAGSGQVKLRKFDSSRNKVLEVGEVSMNSIISPSADRGFAAIAEGNISSGPLKVYDFKQKELKLVTNLNRFNYEVACSRGAKYFACPSHTGCGLYSAHGSSLSNLDGKGVICAAFQPNDDSLFVMRAGATTIERYDANGQKLSSDYELDKPLAMKADVKHRIVTNIHGAGNTIIANTHRTTSFSSHTYQSGRMKVSESGQKLFVVIPTGVYMFSVKAGTAPAEEASSGKPKIKVIEGSRDNN